MAQDNYRKIKLLKLLDLLLVETDEDNPLSTNQICARLEEMGILCDRRTLSKDIALLN
jgi:DNA-directed RNA polymerase specialized sigma54-like protein